MPGVDRRTFLVASTLGLAGMQPRDPVKAAPSPARRKLAKPARSTILFFLCGGASHVDTWDMKPDAPAEYRGPFDPINTSARGLQLCEHLPMTAQQAHHLAVVQGVTDYGRTTGDHHAGYYYNLTGHVPDTTFRTQGNDRRPQPDDWPFMGSVVGSRREPHRSLPQVITLPHKPSRPPYTRPGQFAARLGVEHDPLYLLGNVEKPLEFAVPTLTLQQGLTRSRLNDRKLLLAAVNGVRRDMEHTSVDKLTRQQEKAFDLLASTTATDAFDLSQEAEATQQRYGTTINGMSLLMARRLVEAGVPFVTVFWREDERIKAKCKSAGAWDTHGNNFNCLKEHLLPEFDRGFSALLEDLSQRGLLEETLVLVTSEMGRKPKIGDPRSGGTIGAGRDHWTACMSVLMAGGGVRGGQVCGRTDARAEYPDGQPIGPEDVARTVFHAMGVDNSQIRDESERPLTLLDTGRPLLEIF